MQLKILESHVVSKITDDYFATFYQFGYFIFSKLFDLFKEEYEYINLNLCYL